MTVPGDTESEANKAQDVLTQLVFVAVVGSLLLFLISAIHKYRPFDRIYFPVDDGRRRITDAGWFSWIHATWNSTTEDVLAECGAEGALVFCVLEMAMKFFGFATVIGLAGVLPFHIAYSKAAPDPPATNSTTTASSSLDDSNSNSVDNGSARRSNLYTIDAIPNGSSVFFVHTAFTYILVLGFYVLLHTTYRKVLAIKNRYMLVTGPSARTIIVEGIPSDLGDESALAAYFEGLGIGSVVKVVRLRSSTALEWALARRWSWLRVVESMAAECENPQEALDIITRASRTLPSAIGGHGGRGTVGGARGVSVLLPSDTPSMFHRMDSPPVEEAVDLSQPPSRAPEPPMLWPGPSGGGDVLSSSALPLHVPLPADDDDHDLNDIEADAITAIDSPKPQGHSDSRASPSSATAAASAPTPTSGAVEFSLPESHVSVEAMPITSRSLPSMASNAVSIVDRWRAWARVPPQHRLAHAHSQFVAADARVHALRRQFTRYSKLMPAAYVMFAHPVAETIATQALVHGSITELRISRAPAPADVVYGNLDVDAKGRVVRSALVAAAIFFLIFFWAVPIGAIASLMELDELRKIMPGVVAWIETYPRVRSLVEGTLPTLAVSIFMSLLPTLLGLVAKLRAFFSTSEERLFVFESFFYFQLFNVLLVFTIAGTIFKALQDMLDQPSQIPLLLARSLPQLSPFFFNLLLLNLFVLMPSNLLQTGRVFMDGMLMRPSTPREHMVMGKRPTWEMRELAPTMLMLVIGLVYSVVCPLILPVTLAYSAVAWFGWRYRLLHQVRVQAVYGRVWVGCVRMLQYGLTVLILLMLGILSLRKFVYAAVALLPLLAINGAAWIWINTMEHRVLHTPLDVWRDWRGDSVREEADDVDATCQGIEGVDRLPIAVGYDNVLVYGELPVPWLPGMPVPTSFVRAGYGGNGSGSLVRPGFSVPTNPSQEAVVVVDDTTVAVDQGLASRRSSNKPLPVIKDHGDEEEVASLG
ncbi:hypothetical protein BC828DRAFT_409269 [Blastocladiella britannica]|nr:hypothetical protein BC828DRAFT_409269 [Blastocladiella britannica]